MNSGRKGLLGGGGFAVRPLVAIVVGLLIALLATAILQTPKADAAVDRRAVSAAKGDQGFPVWYQDARGRRVQLCLDGTPNCADAVPADLTPPEGEAFYWSADASIARAGGVDARLVLAAEAAFADAGADSQITFGRIRVRVDNLKPNTRYTITQPYGVMNLRSNGTGVINVTRDVGCIAIPCNFNLALKSPVFDGFLRQKAGAPPGYLGDPTVERAVTGSPTGNNFFRIEGPSAGGRGSGIDRVQTSRFAVMGKLN